MQRKELENVFQELQNSEYLLISKSNMYQAYTFFCPHTQNPFGFIRSDQESTGLLIILHNEWMNEQINWSL